MKKEKKYKYRIRKDIDTYNFPEGELNRMGEDGWELVVVQKFMEYPATYYFKKELNTN